jgi:hypothetical protein
MLNKGGTSVEFCGTPESTGKGEENFHVIQTN